MVPLNTNKSGQPLQTVPILEYLNRIHVAIETPSLEFLRMLHKSHLLSIPLENLDIIFKKKMDLDIGKLFERIVTNKRGGIPLELNILFFHLLHGIGFDCHLVSAKVFLNYTWGPELDLPVVIVNVDKMNYLVDVGSQSLFLLPKKIIVQKSQLDYNQYFRFEQTPDQHFILQVSSDYQNFQNVYQFDLAPKEVILFMERYRYFQGSTDSPFTQNKIVFQHRKDGKIFLTDHFVQIIKKGEELRLPILHEDDFASKLREYFGYDYDQLFRERLD